LRRNESDNLMIITFSDVASIPTMGSDVVAELASSQFSSLLALNFSVPYVDFELVGSMMIVAFDGGQNDGISLSGESCQQVLVLMQHRHNQLWKR
jgi:hypothetical protein